MRLFALEGSEALGSAVAAAAGVPLDPIEQREFAGGEFKSRPLVSVRHEDVYVLHSLGGPGQLSPSDRLVRLLFFVGACRDNGAARVTVLAPYLAFMRKEQQTKSRDPINSRYMAALFEAVGTDMVVTLEVHNPAAFQNAFRCPSIHLETTGLLSEAIRTIADRAPVVVVSPDSGGMRRVHRLREMLSTELGRPIGLAMMEKHRSEGIVSGGLFAGDVAKSTAIVVDDIIDSGGTMLRTAEACREHGAHRVFAMATHGLFSPGSAELFESAAVDSVFVTDSVAMGSLPSGSEKKISILSCAGLIGGTVQRLHSGGSINRLLNPQS
jgi:ribose-phosphate pyrophosphokinase